MIKTHLLPKSAIIPQEKFYPRDDGSIKWNVPVNNSDTVSISFGTIICENNCRFERSGGSTLQLSPLTYSYTLHISDSENVLSSFSKCNLDRQSFQGFSGENSLANQSFFYQRYFLSFSPSSQPPGGKFVIPIKELSVNGTEGAPGPYYVNIVAEVFLKEELLDNVEVFTILYNQAQIYTKIGTDTEIIQKPFYEDKLLLSILIGGGFLILVAIGLFCYYKRKYGKIKKKMKYELSDLGEGKNPDDEVFERENPEKMENFQYKGFIEKEAAN